MNTKTTKETDETEKESFIYGYKALDKNLCASMGNGMKFEVGKTYKATGKLEFCKNGFHFCKNLEDTLDYYIPSKELRFVKVKAYGEVLSDDIGSKSLCRKLKVVKELSAKDALKVLRIEDTLTEAEVLEKTSKVRELLALKGLFLNILVNDEDWRVRCAVAKQGYGLDILVYDEDWSVRCAVARQGYGLDVLVNDKGWSVRCTVAEQGYGLDILVNDENWYVRCKVARQGYGLDILVKDKDWHVRVAVAEQGYGLDILAKDKDWRVRQVVTEQAPQD